MGPIGIAIIGVGVAALVSLFLCRAMMAASILDHPDEDRKAHAQSVPSSGGMGIFAGFVTALILSQFVLGWMDRDIMILMSGAVAALVLGFFDDREPVRADLKMAIQLGIAFAIAGLGIRVETIEIGQTILNLGPVGGTIGSALWILVVMNAVNFMDGANGMAMGSSVVMASGFFLFAIYAGDVGIALATLFLIGGLAGFLRWNLPGRLFAGDAGALGVGVFLAGFALILTDRSGMSLWAGPLILLPFLADVFLTLIWRVRRKRPLMRAHSDHIYQIALRAGLSHLNISGVYWIFSLHTALLAVATAIIGGRIPQIAFIASLAVFVLMFSRIRRAAGEFGFIAEDPTEASTPVSRKNQPDLQAPDGSPTQEGP